MIFSHGPIDPYLPIFVDPVVQVFGGDLRPLGLAAALGRAGGSLWWGVGHIGGWRIQRDQREKGGNMWENVVKIMEDLQKPYGNIWNYDESWGFIDFIGGDRGWSAEKPLLS